MENINLKSIQKILAHELPELKERYSIRSLGIFGSYVKEKQNKDSDLDLLISFFDPPGLFTFIELENSLSLILGTKVDLVMRDALKPKIAERILDELVVVYE